MKLDVTTFPSSVIHHHTPPESPEQFTNPVIGLDRESLPLTVVVNVDVALMPKSFVGDVGGVPRDEVAATPSVGPVGPVGPVAPVGPGGPVAPVAPVTPLALQFRASSDDAQFPFGFAVSITRSAPVGLPCAKLVL
ncbi:MAG TPA: hypothetical protein VLJ76_02655 [Gaiellaceae bacterium]|nr:hypothetical protein [Gaiellaceae bacterium]